MLPRLSNSKRGVKLFSSNKTVSSLHILPNLLVGPMYVIKSLIHIFNLYGILKE